MALKEPITDSLRQLHLPAFVDNYSPQAALATNDGWPYDRYLLALCELELEERRQRKTERLLRESKLPERRPGRRLNSRDCPGPSNGVWMRCSTGTFWIAPRMSWPSAIRAAARPIYSVPSVMNSS